MEKYKNPIKTKGDFADPFILRYNGDYYLYGTNPDIRCWKSHDMINWELCGPTISENEFPGLVPFAPEVVYWNGKFYMYTSPSGFGHHVLLSDHPTGPFHKITDNLHHNIDGSVFIDEDGKWYFYWADDKGIKGALMKSPVEIGEEFDTGCFMNGWTEGPFVVKRNGFYYLTYTGNHYLSKGYRINAAFSDNPLGPYHDIDLNPLIVSVRDHYYGLGHSCTVTGPDLYTDYIVYHNMNPDLSRDLNLTRISMLKNNIEVENPSTIPQNVPAAPTIEIKELFKLKALESRDLFSAKSGDEFRIEIWCRKNNDAASFAIRGTVWEVRIDPENSIMIQSGTNCTSLKCSVIEWTSWQQIRLYKENGFIRLYCGPLLMGEVQISSDQPDQIRILALEKEVEIAHISLKVKDQFVSEYCVPASICVGNDAFIKVYPETPGNYTMMVWSETQPAIIADHKNVRLLPENKNLYRGSISLEQEGIALRVRNGKRLDIFPQTDDLDLVTEVSGYFSNTGKREIDAHCYASMSIDVMLCFQKWEENSAFGVIFKGDNYSEGGEGNDPVLGINFFRGYCLTITPDGIRLTRHRFDELLLCEYTEKVDLGRSLKFRIDVHFNHISVFSTFLNKTIIDFTDDSWIPCGSTGIRGMNCEQVKYEIRIKKGATH